MTSSFLLGLYPREWRQRYGEEFAALLEDIGMTPGVVVDVLTGAFDAQLRKRASDRTAARAQRALLGGGTLTMETNLPGLVRFARGKVRDIYAVGDDQLLIVSTDRVSAFDVVMPNP